MESVPQVYILMVILNISNNVLDPNETNAAVEVDTFFRVTFMFSIAAAAFGIAKFTKSGPTRIVRSDKCLDGFGTLTFLLIFVNAAATLFGKSLLMTGYVINLEKILNQNPSNLSNVTTGQECTNIVSGFHYLGIFLAFLPQLVQVSRN